MASLKERYNRSRTSSPAGRSYAGIGSRDTPEELIPVMEGLGRLMAEGGYQLRSGHAAGADQAFYRGWQAAGEPQGLARIYLPWSGFPGSQHLKRGTEFTAAADDVVFIEGPRLPAWNQAMDLAVAHHPQGEKIRQVGWGKLQGRNSFQVLGDDLASPADLVIAYRNPTAKTSGTDQALKIAAANNIPVLNLADPAVLAKAQHALQSGQLDGLLAPSRPTTYEVSTKGDSRFSALVARLPDGRSIEEAYQLDVKGYRSRGDNWRLGKGKPPLVDPGPGGLEGRYQELWDTWADANPELIDELAGASAGAVLTDQFARPGTVSQATALQNILERRKAPVAARPVPMSYGMPLAALRPDLRETYGRDTSTLELIQQGQRQATTRNPFAKIGEVISFENDPTPYVVTEIRKPDLQSPEGRKAWEDAEGWDLNYIDQDPKLRAQVYSPRAVQTFYRRADQPGPAPSRQRVISPDGFIEELGSDDVFVFGSNLAGRHGKGAALTARQKFGAQYGIGEGLTGRSYALPTKDERLRPLSPQRLQQGLASLGATAAAAPAQQFLLTRVGQGLAGMDEPMVRQLVEQAQLPQNVKPWWTWEPQPQAQVGTQQLELPVAPPATSAPAKREIDWGNVGAHTGAIVGSSLIGYTIADLLDEAEREGWR